VPPWELLERDDAGWWVNEVGMIIGAEKEGSKMREEIAAIRAKRKNSSGTFGE